MALDYAVAEARNQAQADDLRERERAAVASEREAIAAAQAAQERAQAQQVEVQREAEEAEHVHAREQALAADCQSAEAARQQQADRLDRERAEEADREARLPGCEARIRTYERDTATWEHEKRWLPDVRSAQEVFDGRHDVRGAHDDIRQAEADADRDYRSLQHMQHQEECFNRAHPFQAAFGRKPQSPDPDRSWTQAKGDQRLNCLLAQSQVDSARRRLQAMEHDEGIRAACRQGVAGDQARLRAKQSEVMALEADLRARADQQREDKALCQAVARDRQMRAERLAQYGALERDLDRAQRTAQGTYMHRDDAWQALKPVADAREAVRRAEMWRDQMAEALQEHRQRMEAHKEAHPLRAAFGASYRDDAHQVTKKLQGFLQEREQEVRRCTERLQALRTDPAVLG
ncbi:MAG: hypothetical protein EOO40_09430, partial [Deltaproteobacteria bacterium]